MIIETLDHAKARGATIYGTLAGAGITADSHDIVQPDPSGEGQYGAMTKAIEDAGLTASDIVHVNALHVDPQGDVTEAGSIRWLGSAADGWCGDVHQVDDRAPARRRGCSGDHRDGARAARPHGAPHDQPERPRARPGIDIAANVARPLGEGDLAAVNNSFGFANVAVAVTNANDSR